MFTACVASPGAIAFFGHVGRVEVFLILATTMTSSIGILVALNRDAANHVKGPVPHAVVEKFSLEFGLILAAVFCAASIGVAGAATGPKTTPPAAGVDNPGSATGTGTSRPSQVKTAPDTVDGGQQPESSSGATVAPAPCLESPGEDPAIPSAIRTAMIQASHNGATPYYGCIEAVVAQPDGSYVQHFSNSDAFLLGSDLGAGLVNDAVAAEIARGGSLIVANIGGQPLNLIPCFDNNGDFQPFVTQGSVITALYGREVASEVPVEIDPRVLKAFGAEVLDDHVVLAPTGPAITLGGNVVQQPFINPLTGQTVSLSNQLPASELTADELWGACNGGTGAPHWFVASELGN
jgi:hypothetical protein